ncbi:MAG TPA: hypothetical protein VFF27_07530 [Bacteroidia bacterium]|jgi:hypothetical protein|nr:hypothetical protein [Bacteroidia bacterium]
MPNYSEFSVNIATRSENQISSSSCVFDDDRKERLRELIFIINTNSVPQTYKRLYEKAYRHLISTEPVEDTTTPFNPVLPTLNTPNLLVPVLPATTPQDIDVGYMAEGTLVFASYYLSVILAKINGYNYYPFSSGLNGQTNQNPNIAFPPAPPTVYPSIISRANGVFIKNGLAESTEASKADDDQPEIYQKLKNVFYVNGFYEPTKFGAPGSANYNEYNLELNRILDAKKDIGAEISLTASQIDTPDSIKERIAKLILYGNINSLNSETIRFHSSRFIPSLTDAKRTELATELAADILDQIGEVCREFINKESKCLFKRIFSNVDAPESVVLGAGNGETGTGFLGINDLATILFKYKFKAITNTTRWGYLVSTENNFSLNKTVDPVIHINAVGVDTNAAYLVITNTNKSDEKIVFKTYPGDVILTPLANNDVEGNSLYKDRLPYTQDVNKYMFYRKATNDPQQLVATYDKENENLTFANPEEIGSFKFDLNSPHSEDLSVICIVASAYPVGKIAIPLEDVFSDDKFELTKTQIDNLLSSSRDLLAAEILIDKLQSGIIPTIKLKGNFVGTTFEETDTLVSGKPAIKPDPQYYPNSSSPKKETTEEAPGSVPPYKKLRYSFAEITIKDNSIDIEINSFVSPLRSRLDKRFTMDDYRANTANHLDLNLLNSDYTIAGYSLTTLPGDPNPLRSYNSALAMLRSFGLLEGIACRLKLYAATFNPSINIDDKLSAMLANTKSKDQTVDVRPGAPNNAQITKEIDYETYKKFKWYNSLNEKNQNYYNFF